MFGISKAQAGKWLRRAHVAHRSAETADRRRERGRSRRRRGLVLRNAAELLIVDQLRHRRVLAAERALRVAAQLDHAELHRQRVDEDLARLDDYGRAIGLAFQIADDVLDATGTSDELGKTAGRDAQLEKSTYVVLLGIEGARAEAQQLARSAVAHLDRAGVPSGTLGALAGYIVSRTS